VKRLAAILVLAAGTMALAEQRPTGSGLKAEGEATFWDRMSTAIEQHLGRPYVWGAAGTKSFDCSGFVWRVLRDTGVYIKRSTARKYYMSLNPVSEEKSWEPGTIVFFDNLKHCGIVRGKSTFYHAGTLSGTSLARFDPLWRPKIVGFRQTRP
jgi:cell wall-associated NlpC family hydrolase